RWSTVGSCIRDRRGAAPAPRYRDCRRLAAQPGSDALYDAGHLSRLRAPLGTVPPMTLSEPFIRRPVATSLLALALAIAGVLAFLNLAVAPLPQVAYPTIVVNAGLPGASPETMASSVATPLE